MDINFQVLRKKLAGKKIGHKIHYYPETGSTNDRAFELGIAGAPEGTVVIADRQSTGRGRLQRNWHSPGGVNIYTSIILRPKMEANAAPRVSITAGVAIAEILDEYFTAKVHLKWPNDVILNGKKVCGMLSQLKILGNFIDFIVLGVGINVNIGKEDFPPELRGLATSLAAEAGRRFSREKITISLYENLAKWYEVLTTEGFRKIKDKWLSMAPMIGCAVSIAFINEVISGNARGIDDDGSLVIETGNGKERKVSAGDATVLREK
ncbi:MAG TPA: biotin--[acetyl-CoA-carboxylase] ligase [Deltaproteobacteria bacterium]|nr:biotin--[acetyl-CoA-carboxylase] ligase [Deltaproteobacteria bacterium]